MAAGSNTTSGTAGSSQDEASTTLGVGGTTSGEAGATPAHETQAETGGSGGAQLTHSHGESPATGDPKPATASRAAQASEADSTLQTRARGAQDTRGEQGGGTGTGLGSRESGGNQSEGDLPPR